MPMCKYKPLVSVIIPVYNTAQYLCEAIESVLRQTYIHWELILIDDGSTDGSGAICDEYAGKDARIRVIHTKNGGVSCARNIGLDAAKGEWVCFVDSDDWMTEDALEILLSHADGMDVVMGKYPVEAKEPWRELTEKKNYSLCRKDEQEYSELYFLRFFYTSWGKLYRREKLIRRFDEDMNFFEDTCFNMNQIPYWNKVAVLTDTVYHYRVGHTSLTGNIRVDRLWQYRRIFECHAKYFHQCDAVMEHRLRLYLQSLKAYFSGVVLGKSSKANQALMIQMGMEDAICDELYQWKHAVAPKWQPFFKVLCAGDVDEMICFLQETNQQSETEACQ